MPHNTAQQRLPTVAWNSSSFAIAIYDTDCGVWWSLYAIIHLLGSLMVQQVYIDEIIYFLLLRITRITNIA